MGYGQRHEWILKRSAAILGGAAENKIRYHQERLEFWEKELETAEQQLREFGVEFKDFEVTGGKRLEPKVDRGLLNRYEEALNKKDEHEASLRQYKMYARAFEAEQPDKQFEVDIDDLKFFGL